MGSHPAHAPADAVRVETLAIAGAALLHSTQQSDVRGTFRRVAHLSAMQAAGLETGVDQVSVATNAVAGTVRGLHLQVAPHEEAKTLWCASGAVFDVLLDLRQGPAYGTWLSVRLSAEDEVALHVPRGVAHGYQTLTDDASLIYLISAPYEQASARSVRWDDPALAIPWPLPVSRISDRDRDAPAWADISAAPQGAPDR